jgi:hypothetical protein
VTPLRSVDISGVAIAARLAGALSVSGVPAYVAEGLVVSVRLTNDRPKLIVNLTAMRASGADLPAELLKLAQVVR